MDDLDFEFGSVEKIRFATNATAHDEEGNVVYCEREGCEKKSSVTLCVYDTQINLCTDHYKEIGR